MMACPDPETLEQWRAHDRFAISISGAMGVVYERAQRTTGSRARWEVDAHERAHELCSRPTPIATSIDGIAQLSQVLLRVAMLEDWSSDLQAWPANQEVGPRTHELDPVRARSGCHGPDRSK